MSAVPQTIVTVRGLTVAGERVHLELTKLKIEVRNSPAARGRVRRLVSPNGPVGLRPTGEQAELQRMQDTPQT
jgi:hypothetical protein